MPSAPQSFKAIDFRMRFRSLDGIRAMAVTMVFASHYGGGGTHGGTVLKIVDTLRSKGWIGVDVFFVLSGFLITGILFDTRNDSQFFKRFFARRSVRIFPIVYLLFTILALLTPIFLYTWHWKQAFFLVYLGNFFGNATPALYGVHSSYSPWADASIGHLWSLCVEEQFYVVWPVMVWMVRDRVKLLWTSGVLAALTLTVRIVMVNVWSPQMAESWLNRTLPFRLDTLLFGAILALLLRGPAADAIQRSMKWYFLVGSVATLTIFVLSPEYDSPWLLSVGLTFIAAASMGLIGMTLRQGSICQRLFNVKPAQVLGRYSYGFYVWHFVWIKASIRALIYMTTLFHSTALGGLVELPLAFLVIFLMAKLSYDFFEVRFLKLKRHFEYDSELATHTTAFAADGN